MVQRQSVNKKNPEWWHTDLRDKTGLEDSDSEGGFHWKTCLLSHKTSLSHWNLQRQALLLSSSSL